jgi:proline iminopeptidase
VCVPGGPARAAAYLEDLGGLGAHRRLVLLDARGSGRSELPADPATLRFDRQAADLEALRAHLGEARLHVLAHSAGCLVTQAWASAHPERVGSLVLVTPSDRLQGGGREDLPGIRASRSSEPWYADAAEAQAALDAGAPPATAAALTRATRPFFYGRWTEREQAHAASADAQTSKRALLGFGAGVEEVDVAALRAGLAAVDAPALVVGGSRDALTGVASVHLVAADLPRAEAVVVEGAGHFPWVDEPDAFRAVVLAFLETCS